MTEHEHKRRGHRERARDFFSSLDGKTIAAVIISLTSLVGSMRASRQADATETSAVHHRAEYAKRYLGLRDSMLWMQRRISKLERYVRLEQHDGAPGVPGEVYGPPEPAPRPGPVRRFLSFITHPFGGG